MEVALRHNRLRRARHEKSRNGCLSCKNRRIKCDETRPQCRKCTEAGRVCQGVAEPSLRFIQNPLTSMMKKPRMPREFDLLAPQHKPGHERRAFSFFMARAAPLFAGSIDEAFWLRFVPRMAQSDPFVWSMIMAISELFEHVPHSALTTSFDPKPPVVKVNAHHARALEWYNKAISDLRQRLEEGQMNTAHALFSCILIVCVESQQRNVGNVLHLMDHGSRILDQSLLDDVTGKTSPAFSEMREVVTPFFSRHVIRMTLLRRPLLLDWKDRSGSVTSKSSELDKMRRELYVLMYQCYEVIRIAVLLLHDEEQVAKVYPKRDFLLQELEDWKAMFATLLDGDQDCGHETQWLRSNLLMHWNVCHILLVTCTSALQTCFDEYTAQFEALLYHAERSLNFSGQCALEVVESPYELEMIPPLYVAAIKCRDPCLRRKALRLMQRAPRRESVWVSLATSHVVEKVIAIEEGVDFIDFSETAQTCEAQKLPPEEQRVHHVAIIRKRAVGRCQQLLVQLSKFVASPDGSKKIIHENVWMEDDPEQQKLLQPR